VIGEYAEESLDERPLYEPEEAEEKPMTEKDTGEKTALSMIGSNVPWNVFRDDAGYVMGLGKGEWIILHLQRGTVRNEACAEAVLSLLNRGVSPMTEKEGGELARVELKSHTNDHGDAYTAWHLITPWKDVQIYFKEKAEEESDAINAAVAAHVQKAVEGARRSLFQELWETLKFRGFWVPPFDGPAIDIIGAVGKALHDGKKAVEGFNKLLDEKQEEIERLERERVPKAAFEALEKERDALKAKYDELHDQRHAEARKVDALKAGVAELETELQARREEIQGLKSILASDARIERDLKDRLARAEAVANFADHSQFCSSRGRGSCDCGYEKAKSPAAGKPARVVPDFECVHMDGAAKLPVTQFCADCMEALEKRLSREKPAETEGGQP
jgi:hypothetical protein